MGWREVAAQRYPNKSMGDATDLYMQVSHDAVAVSTEALRVKTWQDEGEEPNVAYEVGIRLPQAIEAAAYAVGYRALLADGAANSLDELGKLTDFIDMITERQEARGE